MWSRRAGSLIGSGGSRPFASGTRARTPRSHTNSGTVLKHTQRPLDHEPAHHTGVSHPSPRTPPPTTRLPTTYDRRASCPRAPVTEPQPYEVALASSARRALAEGLPLDVAVGVRNFLRGPLAE